MGFLIKRWGGSGGVVTKSAADRLDVGMGGNAILSGIRKTATDTLGIQLLDSARLNGVKKTASDVLSVQMLENSNRLTTFQAKAAADTVNVSLASLVSVHVPDVLALQEAAITIVEFNSLTFHVTRGLGDTGSCSVQWALAIGQGSPSISSGTINFGVGDNVPKAVTIAFLAVSSTTAGTITLSNPQSTSGGPTPTIGVNVCAVTVQNDSTVPGAVSVTPTVISQTQINLVWSGGADAGSGFKEWVVNRALAVGGPFSELQRGPGTTYNDTGRAPGTQYFYRIDAVDKAGNSASGTANATTQAPIAGAFPLTVTNRKLFKQDGQPFLFNGDACWTIEVGPASDADVTFYQTQALARKFNVALFELVEHKFALNAPATNTSPALTPFSTAGNITTRNDNYFQRVRGIVSGFAANDVFCCIAPLYVGFGGGDEGWATEMMNRSVAECTAYGAYVGTMFAAYPGIMWVMGGDAYNSTWLTRIRAIALGIKSTCHPGNRFSYHAARGQSSTDVISIVTDSWLDTDFVYSDTGTTVAVLEAAAAKTNNLPFFLGEAQYEGESAAPSRTVLRSQAAWSIFAGGCGHIMGNNPRWNSDWPAATTLWKASLASNATVDRAVFYDIITGKDWTSLIPDRTNSVMTAGRGTGDAIALVERNANGSLLMGYTPSQKNLTIAGAQLAGTGTLTWINAQTGVTTAGGTIPNSGSNVITPPSAGDWYFTITSSAADIITHGQTTFVTGSSFGVQATPAPTIRDDCMHGQAITARWSGFTPTTASPSSSNLAYQSDTFGIGYPHARVNKYLSGSHLGQNSATGGNGVGMWKNRTFASFPATAYASWYVCLVPAWRVGTQFNYKFWNYNGAPGGPYELPNNWYLSNAFPPSFSQYRILDDAGGVALTPTATDSSGPIAELQNQGTWFHYEVEAILSKNSDGRIRTWVNGQLRQSYNGRTDNYPGLGRSFNFGGYHGADDIQNPNNRRAFADLYYDVKRDRVVLSSVNATPGTIAAKVIPQVVTNWADDRIDYDVWQGDLSLGDIWEFVQINGVWNAGRKRTLV